jgi:hypothetical protein
MSDLDTLQYEKASEGVFINNNERELALYKSARVRAYREREQSQRIDKLEKELQQIKQLLQKHIVAQRKD